MNNNLKCGVYRHFKGEYVLVLGLARHSETEEKIVVYVPLKPLVGPRITIRPLKMFLENVEREGKKVKRFKYIGSELTSKDF